MKNYRELLRICYAFLFFLAFFVPRGYGQQNCDIPPGNQGCDDGNACTIDIKDAAGNCFHIVLNCDDGNPLTKDSCNPTTGQCVNTPLVCDDDDPSTEDVIDLEGNCRHFKKVCDDGNPRTRDYIDNDGNCISRLIVCDDGDPDTEDYLDDNGICHHVKTIVEIINECDECPDDPDKNDPGACGCGRPDTDTDGDGTPDCKDQCPDDPDKTKEGSCGCGNPEPGTPCDDNDDCTKDDRINEDCECAGIPKDTPECRGETCLEEIGKSCNDGNPCTVNDRITEDCECKGTLKDSDGDGTPDCDDWCPNDPDKTEDGQCGCGSPDTDTDGDGTPDCNDWCPNDPDKTEDGQCGCGNPEPGAPCDDNDDCTKDDRINEDCECAGIPKDTPECRGETCVEEIGKTCDDGNVCTVNDKITEDCECRGTLKDADQDGTPDCEDWCPNDPDKTEMGACGCGTPDTDTDGDGTPDCNDTCPNDPNNLCQECPNDLEGCDGYINFVSCDKVIVCLGKDISNIVVDLGATGFQSYGVDLKFDNLSGRRWTYVAPVGATINGIWVKTADFCGKCTDDEELYGCVECEGDACPQGNGAGPYYLNDKRCEGEDVSNSDLVTCQDPTDNDGDGTPNCQDFCLEDPDDQCVKCSEELEGCMLNVVFPACDKIIVCAGETIQHIVVDLGPRGFQRFSVDRKFSGIHDTHWEYQAPYGQPIHGVWVKTKGNCPSCEDNEVYGCADGPGDACPRGNIGGRYYRNANEACAYIPEKKTTEEARIELNLFPNPASRELFVNINNIVDRSGSIQVLNTNGDAVYILTLDGLRQDHMKIHLANQPNGLYFLRVILDNGDVLTKQFVLAE